MIDALILSMSLYVPMQDAYSSPVPVIARSMHSPKMNGVHLRESSYRGIYYRESQEDYRKCTIRRESNGNAWSRSKSRKYQGAFQMSKDLWIGATYMMTPELKKEFGPRIGRVIARELRSLPASKAATRWQEQAFYTVLNWEHDWSGKKHWAGGRWQCG